MSTALITWSFIFTFTITVYIFRFLFFSCTFPCYYAALLRLLVRSICSYLYLTLFRMGFFRAAHGWGWGGKNATAHPKICHTYPTMMKLGTVIPYPKKIQKIHEPRDTPLEFFWHQHFLPKISKFCYIKKYRFRLYFDT